MYAHHIFFIQSSIDENISYILAIIMIGVQLSLWYIDLGSFRYVYRSGIARSYGNCILRLSEKPPCFITTSYYSLSVFQHTNLLDILNRLETCSPLLLLLWECSHSRHPHALLPHFIQTTAQLLLSNSPMQSKSLFNSLFCSSTF